MSYSEVWVNAIKILENKGLLPKNNDISWEQAIELSRSLKEGYKTK